MFALKSLKLWNICRFRIYQILCSMLLSGCFIKLCHRYLGVPNSINSSLLHKQYHHRQHVTLYNKMRHKHKLLNLWNDIASHYNITYFVSSGALLGKYRNNNFLEFDGDIDIIIINETKICNVYNSFEDNQYIKFDKIDPIHTSVIFKHAKETKTNSKYLSDKQFLNLNVDTDYVWIMKGYFCKNPSENKMQIFSYIINVKTAMPLEFFPYRNFLTYKQKDEAKQMGLYQSEYAKKYNVNNLQNNDINFVLPIKKCSIGETETLCPNNIEGWLKWEMGDLSPPIFQQYMVIWWLILLGCDVEKSCDCFVLCLFEFFFFQLRDP
eukprot:79383_1